MINEPKIFSTQNVDLATFLMLEGIKFLECQKSESNKSVVILRFLDEKHNCLDLEQVYVNSKFKQYRDLNKWLLAKIHKTLKE